MTPCRLVIVTGLSDQLILQMFQETFQVEVWWLIYSETLDFNLVIYLYQIRYCVCCIIFCSTRTARTRFTVTECVEGERCRNGRKAYLCVCVCSNNGLLLLLPPPPPPTTTTKTIIITIITVIIKDIATYNTLPIYSCATPRPLSSVHFLSEPSSTVLQ